MTLWLGLAPNPAGDPRYLSCSDFQIYASTTSQHRASEVFGYDTLIWKSIALAANAEKSICRDLSETDFPKADPGKYK